MSGNGGGSKDVFADFLNDPSRETFRDLMRGHWGETAALDFKREWPKIGPLMKHVLGLANSGGGCLVIGVEENADKALLPVGLSSITDKADLLNGFEKFLGGPLKHQVFDFVYDSSEYKALEDKKFQVLVVEPQAEAVPYVCQRDGDKLRAGAIYIRREGKTEEASYAEVREIIAARIEAGLRASGKLDLELHLKQLKTLYSFVEKKRVVSWFPAPGLMGGLGGMMKDNPNYPSEDMEKFVIRMIDAKKKRIEHDLGV